MRNRHGRKCVGLVVAVFCVACSGARGVGANARAATPASAFSATSKDASGMPEWISRSNAAVVNSDGHRVFYGVGVATGIRNPGLLRSAADNRARAELGKLFETFSASLMKDYMSSTDGQSVEQAVKTVSTMSQKGVQIVDRYTARDGTLYALASLDLAAVKDVLAQAEASGVITHSDDQHALDAIFDAQAQRRAHAEAPAPTPPSASLVSVPNKGVPAAPPAPRAPEGSKGGEAVSGARPAWVDGADAAYPDQQYLCAVGLGPDRQHAEDGSLAAMARIFVARVQSVSQDFLGAYAQSGAPELQVQSSEQITKVTTDKLLTGVRVMSVWTDTTQKTTYAWACLERAPAAQSLREQMTQADGAIARSLDAAREQEKRQRVKSLGNALAQLAQREAWNGQLRIIAPDGIGMSGPYAYSDVSAAFDAAVEALQVGVRVSGPYAEDLRTALIEGLARQQLQAAAAMPGDNSDSGPDGGHPWDVLVTSVVRIEGNETLRAGRSLYMARAVAQVDVVDVASGKVLAALQPSQKEGHFSKEEAERRAVRKLATVVTTQISQAIENAMLR